MSDTESLDYLQTGFDPSSLTVPRLRSILVSYDIPYPASAKKPQLIEIFVEKVLPQSRKILSTRARARRTSKGIVNAPSEDSTVVGDDDAMPPPPTPRSRSRKSSSRVKVEESEPESSVAKSPVKKKARSSSKSGRPSESDTGGELSVKKTPVRRIRNSDTPVKVEQAEPELPSLPAPILDRPTPVQPTAFSDDNPFQSGSSPLSNIRPASDIRRKSAGVVKDPERRKTASSTTRKSLPITKSSELISTGNKKYELPVSQLNGLTDVDDNGVEAGEEFTPEEQMELVRERSVNGVNAVGPRRPKKKSAGPGVKGPLSMVFLAILGGYATWYRQEKLAVGYCGVGREATSVIPENLAVPEWLEILAEPQCEPCPQHAYCYDNMVTRCETDFVLKPHPLSLNGLVPVAPTCEPDGEKVRRVKAVADRAIEELRERRAKFECGELTDDAGAPVPTVEIDAEELKQVVSQKRRKGMSAAEFEELWTPALGEIEAREEVESSDEGTSTSSRRHLLSSTSLARISISCAIRRSFRLSLARYRIPITLLSLLSVVFLYARYKYASYTAAVAKVPELVALTLERLNEQASWHVADKETFPEPWISVGQLRDDVLRGEHSASKREQMWTRVRRVVEMNANVRASQREGRNGEVSRVWEWIGAIAALPETGSFGVEGGRRKSGRVSWGQFGPDMSSPVSGMDPGPEMVQAKWQERPIY